MITEHHTDFMSLHIIDTLKWTSRHKIDPSIGSKFGVIIILKWCQWRLIVLMDFWLIYVLYINHRCRYVSSRFAHISQRFGEINNQYDKIKLKSTRFSIQPLIIFTWWQQTSQLPGGTVKLLDWIRPRDLRASRHFELSDLCLIYEQISIMSATKSTAWV